MVSINMGANGVGTVSFGEPDKVNVVFYPKLVPDLRASQIAGRPQSKNEDYVRIQHPGEKDFSDTPVRDKPFIVDQFPAQWQAYQRHKQYVPEGTPIELLFAQPVEQPIAANMRSLGIHTVEQLANLTANAVEGVGLGAQQYVNHAKKYIETASRGVEFHRLQKELASRDNKIEVLENNLRLMQIQIERLSAEKTGQAQQTLISPFNQAPLASQAAPAWPTASPGNSLGDTPPWISPAAPSPAGFTDPTTLPHKRGRPKGSKNKSKSDREGISING